MKIIIIIGRYVGFVSAVVGLFCYAVSSSFNHLFGDWNLFKIFIYFIFTFIISSITLFAKKREQRSLSPHFKTHMALLVLIATNLYSFFYDKAVNEKPDVYILLSCVAFAVMCLSLSTRTQCGCEPDLANFFLGCLIILLMKINLWLTFVGIGFSYSLTIIIFPYYLNATADATREGEYSGDYVAVPMDLLLESGTNGVNSQHINCDSAIQIDSLLIMTRFKACISAVRRTDEIMLQELCTYVDKYLEASKFLVGHPISQEPTDDNLLIDSLPSETIKSLHESVKLMMAAGLEEECCRLYSRCRGQFLQNFLRKLQLSDFKSGGSHPSLIQMWLKACYTALRILFPWERRLCHRVFSGFSSAADLSFMKVCRELTIDLLSFPNNLTIESHPLNYVEKNFKVFQILSDLIPEFESVFCDDCSVSLKNEAITSLGRLREGNMLFFKDLRNHIRRDRSQKRDPGFSLLFEIAGMDSLQSSIPLQKILERSREINRLLSEEFKIQKFNRKLHVPQVITLNFSFSSLREGKRDAWEELKALTEELKRWKIEQSCYINRLDTYHIQELASTFPLRFIQPNLEAKSKKINPAAGCRYHPTTVSIAAMCSVAHRHQALAVVFAPLATAVEVSLGLMSL